MSTAVSLDAPILILVFGMPGCPACEAYLPRFRKVAARHPTIPAWAIDSNRDPATADRFGVGVTPTTVLLSQGVLRVKREGEGNVADIEYMFRYAEHLLAKQAEMNGIGWRRG